jgi:DNA-binding YbaB/EbfC family protein
MNIQKLMKQAQQMQEAISGVEVEGVAGGGTVRVRVNGSKHVLSVRIEPAALEGGDPTLIEDLVLAAIHDAERKIEQEVSGRLGGGLPGMV